MRSSSDSSTESTWYLTVNQLFSFPSSIPTSLSIYQPSFTRQSDRNPSSSKEVIHLHIPSSSPPYYHSPIPVPNGRSFPCSLPTLFSPTKSDAYVSCKTTGLSIEEANAADTSCFPFLSLNPCRSPCLSPFPCPCSQDKLKTEHNPTKIA